MHKRHNLKAGGDVERLMFGTAVEGKQGMLKLESLNCDDPFNVGRHLFMVE